MGAIVNALPSRKRSTSAPLIQSPALIGTLLQAASPLAITLSLSSGPLSASRAALATVLVLAPLSAALFLWAVFSTPRTAPALVTRRAYAFVRHPMYLAFLGMLAATGLLVSDLGTLAIAIVLFAAGTELRIVHEERDLAARFPADYTEYCRRTRWRYLPLLR